MKECIKQNIDQMRVTYGAGLVLNFFGAKMEFNYCLPVKHESQDKVCSYCINLVRMAPIAVQ